MLLGFNFGSIWDLFWIYLGFIRDLAATWHSQKMWKFVYEMRLLCKRSTPSCMCVYLPHTARYKALGSHARLVESSTEHARRKELNAAGMESAHRATNEDTIKSAIMKCIPAATVHPQGNNSKTQQYDDMPHQTMAGRWQGSRIWS